MKPQHRRQKPFFSRGKIIFHNSYILILCHKSCEPSSAGVKKYDETTKEKAVDDTEKKADLKCSLLAV